MPRADGPTGGHGTIIVFHPVTFQKPKVILLSAVLQLKLPNRNKTNLDIIILNQRADFTPRDPVTVVFNSIQGYLICNLFIRYK